MTHPASVCPTCGGRLATGTALDALCPACLLAAALSDGGDDVGEDLENRYVIVNVLGEGKYGTTWVARSVEMPHVLVALKFLRPDATRERWHSALAAYVRDAATRAIPGIAAVEEGGIDVRGRPYLVTQFVAGRTLVAEAVHNRLEPPEMLGLFAQTCDAVQRAFECGLIHGHIVAENIRIVGSRADAKATIMDFGLAALPDGMALSGDDDRRDLAALLDSLLSARRAISRAPQRWDALRRRIGDAISISDSAGTMAALAARVAAEQAIGAGGASQPS